MLKHLKPAGVDLTSAYIPYPGLVTPLVPAGSLPMLAQLSFTGKFPQHKSILWHTDSTCFYVEEISHIVAYCTDLRDIC
jgi:hypothetical protein